MTSPAPALDHRERGSALTATVSVIAALLILGSIIVAFYYFDTPPPASQGQVLSLDVFPVHNTSGGGIIANGISGQPESFDEVIVLANVQLKNTSKAPLHIFDLDSYLYIPNSDTYENGAASPKDFQRVFMAYPQLKPKQGSPLLRDTVLEPGQKVEGQLVFHYPLTLQQWQSRSKMHIIINWTHQDNLVLNLKGSATRTGWQH